MVAFKSRLSDLHSICDCFSEEIHLLRSQVQESKSLCQAAEVERDRLLELVNLLQRR